MLDSLGKVLILNDSRAALLQLKKEVQGRGFAHVVSDLCRDAEWAGWLLSFRWVPSHRRSSGNVRADPLATSAHCQSPNMRVDHFFETIHEHMRRYHPEDVAPVYNVPLAPC